LVGEGKKGEIDGNPSPSLLLIKDKNFPIPLSDA
jgi:hypothetical protein